MLRYVLLVALFAAVFARKRVAKDHSMKVGQRGMFVHKLKTLTSRIEAQEAVNEQLFTAMAKISEKTMTLARIMHDSGLFEMDEPVNTTLVAPTVAKDTANVTPQGGRGGNMTVKSEMCKTGVSGKTWRAFNKKGHEVSCSCRRVGKFRNKIRPVCSLVGCKHGRKVYKTGETRRKCTCTEETTGTSNITTYQWTCETGAGKEGCKKEKEAGTRWNLGETWERTSRKGVPQKCVCEMGARAAKPVVVCRMFGCKRKGRYFKLGERFRGCECLEDSKSATGQKYRWKCSRVNAA